MAEPEPYREAVVAARGIIQEVDEETAQALLEALEAFADGLEANLVSDFSDFSESRLDSSTVREQTEAIVRAQASDLRDEVLDRLEQGRTASFERVLEVWQRAGVEAAEAVGVDMAALGRLRGAPVSLMGVFESFNAPEHWSTLVQGHVEDAASEANRVLRQGFAEGIGPQEMSRRLRRYVVGSEQFDELFEEVPTVSGDVAKLDLRKVPQELQGAARQVEFNARRIAFTEYQQARGEAEVQHFLRDPMVKGVRRQLSPNRGRTFDGPDECDVLATQDLYDMGPGVYPVGKAPPLAVHPFDRCEHVTVGRPVAEMDQPKPTPDRVVTSGGEIDVPDADDVTAARAESIRENTIRALEDGERAWEEIQERAAA